MRSSRQQQKSANANGRFPPSPIPSYKYHVNAVKSLLPEGASHRNLNPWFLGDMKTALNIDTLKGKHAGDTKSLHHNPGPGFLSAFSFRDEITSCPERLDLDRRALTEFPHLDGFDRLRLLNLQHNNISKMQPLKHLQNLVILDLYGNQIFDMCGLSSLKSLRVLLLGNNRIQRICDMDGLGKLDALDLRNNQISEIENLSALSCLRSLNLSGNRIRRVDNLQGLNSLIELDLRNNTISLVTDVENLPRLQRLFLSHNSISSLDDLGEC
ncbi:hypothetical protein DNTS_029713 [Danionella cerebrum]|uniref:Uncharacterized protein n=2 Tax=Danionella cerebrum TaxID=2873325 RepID=A0A553RLJ6_9TELE|nr:hypothetical protein DNTS_029713 [Danionella translucida]